MEDNELTQRRQIIDINIEDQMKATYINYSMSVIVSRALPDVSDGLKPVIKSIVWCYRIRSFSNRPTKKVLV